MSTQAVLIDARQSVLIADLMASLHTIAAKLTEQGSWRSFAVQDPELTGAGYERLVCQDSLCSPDGAREYRVGVHRFGVAERATAMHDHRYPFAVYPFGPPRGESVYEMPWERQGGTGADMECGLLVVRSGHPYAIHDCGVRHAVVNARSYLSVTIADVTMSPARVDRMQFFERTFEETNELRLTALASLKAAIGFRRSLQHWLDNFCCRFHLLGS